MIMIMFMIVVMTTAAAVFGSVIDHVIRTCDRASRTSSFTVSAPSAIVTYEGNDIINNFETIAKTGIDTGLTANTFFCINFGNVHSTFLT